MQGSLQFHFQIFTFLTQSLNDESIELKCDSQFHEQHHVTRYHKIKLDFLKNMALTNVIGRCKCHEAINGVPLFEHTLCVSSLFAYGYGCLDNLSTSDREK